MLGPIPRPVRFVKPYVYRVQYGDSVSRIAAGLVGDPDRWPELVGANLHKELGGCAEGRCRVFSTLGVGESLRIPADWPESRGVVGVEMGSVGDPVLKQDVKTDIKGTQTIELPEANQAMIDTLSKFRKAFKTIYDALVASYGAGWSLPGAYTRDDIANVIWSWWEYMRAKPDAFTTLPPEQIASIPDASAGEMWKLIVSAGKLLEASKATSDAFIRVPWDRIRWNEVPWQHLYDAFGSTGVGQFWLFLTTATQGAKGFVGALKSLAPAIRQPSTPDFANTDWTKPPWTGVNQTGWRNVNWQSSAWDEGLDDPVLLACLEKADAGRLAQLQANQACFVGKPELFKKYACGTMPVDDCKKEGKTPTEHKCDAGFEWSDKDGKCMALGTLPEPPKCDPGTELDKATNKCVPTKASEAPAKQEVWPWLLGGVALAALAGGVLVLTSHD